MMIECLWIQDGEDSDIWQTSCNHFFVINDGTPSENEMKFCCFCGRDLVDEPFIDAEQS